MFISFLLFLKGTESFCMKLLNLTWSVCGGTKSQYPVFKTCWYKIHTCELFHFSSFWSWSKVSQYFGLFLVSWASCWGMCASVGACVFYLIISILSQHLPAPPQSSVWWGRMLRCPAHMTLLRLKESQVSAGDVGRCLCLNAPTRSSHPRTGVLFSGGPPGTSCWDGSRRAIFPWPSSTLRGVMPACTAAGWRFPACLTTRRTTQTWS